MIKGWLRGCGWAVGTVGLACIVEIALNALSLHAPFLPFVAAVALTALYAGALPALLALVMSLLLVNSFFLREGEGVTTVETKVMLSLVFASVASLLGWLAVAQRRSDAARIRAESWFQAAQEVSPDGFCILLPLRDAKGGVNDLRWLYANPALERILGREDLAGRQLFETLPGLLRQRSLLRKGLRVLRTGRPKKVEFYQDADGLRGWLRLWVVKLREGLAVSVIDITERKRAGEELQRSETRLRAFQDTSLDGFIVFKAVREEGRIVDLEYTFANPVAERLINQGPLVGRRLLELMPSHGGPEGPFARYVRVIETGVPQDEEFYYEGEGVRGWFRNMSVKLEDGVAMAFTDITVRKLVEEALRRNETQLRSVVENLAEGLIVANPEGDLLHWNRAALDMHGFQTVQECRRRLHEFFHIFEISTLEGKVLPLSEWPLSRVLRGEQIRNVELRVRRHAGDWERIYSYGGVLVRDADGTPLMALLTVTDATERKRAEEALRRSEAALAKAGMMAHFGAWDLDIPDLDNLDATLLHWSDEVYRIFGYEPGSVEVSDAFFYRHVHPEDARRVRSALMRAVGEKRPYAVEHRILRPDGSERTVMEYAEVTFGEDGKALRMVGAIQDITERKQAEEALRTFAQRLEERVAERTEELARSYEALRQSERLAAIGQMVAAFSHESRNAIQNSVAALEMLRRCADQPRQRRYAEMGLRSLEDLKQIHEEVRDYAAPLRLERLNHRLDELWRAAWDDLSAEREGRDARLVEHVNGAHLQGEVDPLRMKQVFRNLLENSLGACEDPVEIDIRMTETRLGNGPAVCIQVSDNGPGVDPATADQIFEAFYTTKAKGTGLGLAIVRRIVEAHGGSIELGPQRDRGLALRLVLPKQAPPPD